MLSILSWLIGSKTGRIVAVVGLTALAIGFAVLQAFQKGKAYEQAKAAQKRIEVLRNQIQANEEVGRMSRSERDEYVSKWLRPDE